MLQGLQDSIHSTATGQQTFTGGGHTRQHGGGQGRQQPRLNNRLAAAVSITINVASKPISNLRALVHISSSLSDRSTGVSTKRTRELTYRNRTFFMGRSKTFGTFDPPIRPWNVTGASQPSLAGSRHPSECAPDSPRRHCVFPKSIALPCDAAWQNSASSVQTGPTILRMDRL